MEGIFLKSPVFSHIHRIEGHAIAIFSQIGW